MAVVLMASVLVVVGPVGEAEACSCALEDPAAMLEGADAAFVGTLIQRPSDPIDPNGFEGIWVFEVEKWVKGDLGGQVGVRAPMNGAGCGFEMAEGEQAGVFLYNVNGHPTSGLCSVTTAAGLRAAEGPLVFDGSGDPVFLLSGQSGRTRLMTLDASGRLLAAAGDERSSWSAHACPGGERIIEVVEGEVIVRATSDLSQERTVAPPGIEGEELSQAWCLDPGADRILGLLNGLEQPTLRLVDLAEPAASIFTGRADQLVAIDVGLTHAAVASGPAPAGLNLIDLADHSTIEIPPPPGELTTVRFSPGGTELVVGSTQRAQDGYQTVLNVLETGEDGAAADYTGEPMASTDFAGWVDDHRLALTHYPDLNAEVPQLLLLDTATGATTEIEVPGWHYRAMSDGLVSVGDGTLWFTPTGGETAELAELPSPAHNLVTILDPGAEITIAAQRAATTEAAPPSDMPPSDSPQASEPGRNDAPLPAVAAAVIGAGGLLAVAGWAIRRRRSA